MMNGMKMIKFSILLMINRWKESDNVFKPHDDDEWMVPMGMVTMSADGQDVDDNDDDGDMTM